MAKLVVPKMPTFKQGDSMLVRRQIFFDWCQDCQRVNQLHMLPLGVKKRWWQLLKSEHPFTRKVSMEGIKQN